MRSKATAMLLTLLLSVPLALADTFVTVRSFSEGMPGVSGAAQDETGTLWLTEDKFRKDQGDQSFIVDIGAKKLFIVNHSDKSCQTLDLPIDMAKLVPEEMRAMFEQMIEQMNMRVEVTPTEETREIAGYRTKLYRVAARSDQGLESDQELWMTEDVPFDVNGYKQMTEALFSMQPLGADWKKEVLAIEGFPVLQETTVRMMGNEFKAREELISIEEKDAPAGTYAPPPDYTMKPFDFMAGFGGGS
jgi:hypothetical protein